MFEKDYITDALKKVGDGMNEVAFRWHISKNMYVTVDSGRPYVNIRQWWMPHSAEERKRICLTTDEWQTVLEMVVTDVEKLVPDVNGGVACVYNDDHANQEGMLACSHRRPNTCEE